MSQTKDMEVIHTVAGMEEVSARWRASVDRIALVPTMGALHAGHRALIECGRRLGDKLVVSVFVNPTQFGPHEDLEAYPRPLETDCEEADRCGADAVFAPSPAEVYPPGFQTAVEVTGLTVPLCGQSRPGHFRGVTTVVLKLFLIVQPHVAVFGWKDAQQLIVLRQMVGDLNLPIQMVGVETVRESDGLALSSRNQYLSASGRAAAPALYRGLTALKEAARAGERRAERLLAVAKEVIGGAPEIDLQYLEMRSLDRLDPLEEIEDGNTLVALAALLGKTRLIDNIRM